MLKFIFPRPFGFLGFSRHGMSEHGCRPRFRRCFAASSQGFSMIEVLISILLVSFGLLGAAAMYARAVEFSTDTERRQMAAMLAGELLEIMRSDITRILDAKGKPKSDLGGYAKQANDEIVPSQAEQCRDVLPTSISARMACWAGRAQSVMPEITKDFIQQHFVVSTASGLVSIQVAWPVKPGQCLDNTNNEFCTYVLQSRL